MKNNKSNNYDSPFLQTKHGYKATWSLKSLANISTDSGNAAFSTEIGNPAVTTLAINSKIKVGENIDFAGHKFTVVSGNPKTYSQVKLAYTTQETARNLATSILNSTGAALSSYDIDVNGADVIITQRNASANTIPIDTHAAPWVTHCLTTFGTTCSFNLLGIKDISEFSAPTTIFSFSGRTVGVFAKKEALKYSNPTASNSTAHAGDTTASYNVTIGDKIFNGAVYLPNGTDTVNGMAIRFIHADTGEWFETTFGPTNGNNLSNLQAPKIATYLTELFANTKFNQTQKLEINTELGDILSASGEPIASLKGMTASLTSTSGIANKKFTGFSFKVWDSNKIEISAKISTPQEEAIFNTTKTSDAQIAAMVQGSKLDLTDPNTGDVLTINLGEKGLSALRDSSNCEAISQAFNSAFLRPMHFSNNLDEVFCNLPKYVDWSGGFKKLLYLPLSKSLEPVYDFLSKKGVVFNKVLDSQGKVITYTCHSFDNNLANELAKFLVSLKVNVKHINQQGETFFTVAAKLGNSGLISSLFADKVLNQESINKPDSEGYTPLIHAAMRSDLSMFETLCKYGASIEETWQILLDEYNQLIISDDSTPFASNNPTLKTIITNLTDWDSNSHLLFDKFGPKSQDLLSGPKMAFVLKVLVTTKVAKLMAEGKAVEEDDANQLASDLETFDLFGHKLQNHLKHKLSEEKANFEKYRHTLPKIFFEFSQLILQGVDISNPYKLTTMSIDYNFVNLFDFLTIYHSYSIDEKHALFKHAQDKHNTEILQCLIAHLPDDFTIKYETLDWAVKNNHTSLAKWLADRWIDTNNAREFANNAVTQKSSGLLEFLIENHIKQYDIDGKFSFIFHAISNNTFDLAQCLITKNIFADLPAKYKNDLTLNLLKKHRVDLAKLVVEKYTDIDPKVLVAVLVESIRKGHFEFIEPLIKMGADPFAFVERDNVKLNFDYLEPLTKMGINTFAALEILQNEKLELSAWKAACLPVITSTAPLRIIDAFTPLFTIIKNRAEILKHIPDEKGLSPLMYLAANQNYTYAKILFASGIDASECLDQHVCTNFSKALCNIQGAQKWFSNFKNTAGQLMIWGTNPELKISTINHISNSFKNAYDNTPKLDSLDSYHSQLNQLQSQLSIFYKNLTTAFTYTKAMIKNEVMSDQGSLKVSKDVEQLIIARLKFYFSQHPSELANFDLEQHKSNFSKDFVVKLEGLMHTLNQNQVKAEVSKVEMVNSNVTHEDNVKDWKINVSGDTDDINDHSS